MKKILILIILLCAQKLSAQTTYAVIVGISDYKIADYDSGDLRWADRDAQKMYGILNPKKSRNVVLLLNEKATRTAIENALQMTLLKAGPKDKVIFYFSGHGAQGAFIPYDIDPAITRVLSHENILKIFSQSKAGRKLIIADACYSGSISKPRFNTGGAKDEMVLMMLSSRKTQTSIENSRAAGGLFTYVLLKGLKGDADKKDKKDGKVTAAELFRYTKEKLVALTNNTQVPQFQGKFPSGWVLSVYQ